MNYFQKVNVYKRGVSLVEIMITVAMVGILAAISFPSYKSYRDNSKKVAYKTDLADLHKAWLGWSIESGNFCKRKRRPRDASFTNVGMGSLYTNGRYGHNNPAQPARCTGSTTCSSRTTQATCTGGCRWVPATEKGYGPGKANFIGFGDELCSNIVDVENMLLTDRGKMTTYKIFFEEWCRLRPNSYNMGVVGFLSGSDFFGQSITHEGVLSAEQSSATPACPL